MEAWGWDFSAGAPVKRKDLRGVSLIVAQFGDKVWDEDASEAMWIESVIECQPYRM